MTICANRPDTPAFFTPCHHCPCGQQVRDELANTLEEPSE